MPYIAGYIALYGIFGFGLFIIEESIQSLQFGGWQLEKTGSYQEIITNSDLMEGMNKTMRLVNNIGGWMNPIGFVAYRQYATATDRYVLALRTTVFAHRPELLAGRSITTNLRPTSVQSRDGRYLVNVGKIRMWANKKIKPGEDIQVTGHVKVDGHGLVWLENTQERGPGMVK